MEWILDEPQEKNYYLNVRKFASGAFEAVLKAVRPLKEEMIDAAIDGCATSSAWLAPRFEKSDEEKERIRQANHSRAVRRAKQNIRWLCKSMEADRLFTITYRENIKDRELVKKNFKRFLDLVRERFPDWQYVAVLEKQDRGAFHIHCAVKGWQRIDFLRLCWHRALGFKTMQLGENSPGNVNVTSPNARFGSRRREWKTNKLAGYITKYLHKTFDEESSEKRRFWRSKDIQVPVKRMFWVGGADISTAVFSACDLLRLDVGMQKGAFMWLSDSEDCFWFAGEGD